MTNRLSPKNRLATPLPLLRIEIHHRNGMLVYDPNTLAIAGSLRILNELPPYPKWRSVLSGSAGVLWRSDSIEAVLTPNELERLARRELRPTEVLALIERYGIAHEWHDDFYDDENGDAFQPMDEEAYLKDIASLS